MSSESDESSDGGAGGRSRHAGGDGDRHGGGLGARDDACVTSSCAACHSAVASRRAKSSSG